MSRNKVIWEKWNDPFEDEDEDKKADVDDDEVYKDSYEKAENGDEIKHKKKFSGPVLVGPMGVVPLNENNSPSKVYNFWMMHTNFNIGKKQKQVLIECPGVETLDIFTRYRARVGIGKVFDEKKVMQRITKRLCPIKKKSETLSKIDILKKQMSSQYEFWAIYVKKNGEIDMVGGKTQEAVKNRITETDYAEVHRSWEQ